MKLVIFGLTMSSSWGNGHATLWRGLCRALVRRGHDVVFYERDVPYYAAHRDLAEMPGMRLELYTDWESVSPRARGDLRDADVGMVTSFCPDAESASRLLLDSPARLRTYYDLDAPVTLERIERGEKVAYIPEAGLKDFDLVLSYAGGRALDELKSKLGARTVAPLYGSVDPEIHRRVVPRRDFTGDLTYIGTYARDRQPALEQLFLTPAARLPERRFVLAGSMYPADFPWAKNIYYLQHLAPGDHGAFYSSSRLTLNITREAMARCGYCPSGRLFEAAACGTPLLSDPWEGLGTFFTPGSEILIARANDPTGSAVEALLRSDEELARIGRAARERALACHTADVRAEELERLLENALHAPREEEAQPSAPTAQGWGIIPAAGLGSRIQPLAFSKELLPVGSRRHEGVERPRAVSEFLAERMVRGGAGKLCFVIAPGKSDILEYYGGSYAGADVCYAVQPKPAGLCDAIFRAAPLVQPHESVSVGLPDTVWFPEDGFALLPSDELAFLLFPVKQPQVFDAVLLDESGHVREIEVKKAHPSTHWIWGAFRMPGHVFHELHRLWLERDRRDEFFGTLVNEYIRRGGRARGVRAGKAYVDVGTLHGYREAIQVLTNERSLYPEPLQDKQNKFEAPPVRMAPRSFVASSPEVFQVEPQASARAI